jgi:hypothetical protein
VLSECWQQWCEFTLVVEPQTDLGTFFMLKTLLKLGDEGIKDHIALLDR